MQFAENLSLFRASNRAFSFVLGVRVLQGDHQDQRRHCNPHERHVKKAVGYLPFSNGPLHIATAEGHARRYRSDMRGYPQLLELLFWQTTTMPIRKTNAAPVRIYSYRIVQ